MGLGSTLRTPPNPECLQWGICSYSLNGALLGWSTGLSCYFCFSPQPRSSTSFQVGLAGQKATGIPFSGGSMVGALAWA